MLLAAGRTSHAADMTPAADNPFFTVSPLPFHYPPFDKIKDSDYAPAFSRGMADRLKEVDVIATNPDKPTFDNTIVALERSGLLLDRVHRVFDNLNSCNTDDAMDKIASDFAPLFSANDDAVFLNTKLFARIKAVYDERATLGLDSESLRLVERYNEDFVRAGANLSESDKEKLKALNAKVASLTNTFSQNVLKERNASSVFVTDRAELAGLTEAEITAAATAAKNDKHDGQYEIAILNTTEQPDLVNLTNRSLRQRIMDASLARGTRGGPFDNQQVVVDITKARAERAALLGFPTHADYRVANQTAHTVGAIDHLLEQLTDPSIAAAKRDAADMQAIIDQEKGGFQLAACDWQFYAEKVRKARYDFDGAQLKPYFELNHVLFDGVFYAANKLYGVTFKERHDLPVYQPDVRVFDIFDADGKPLAILIEDFYARPSKQGGAWMNEYVSQAKLFGQGAVIANHHNIPKPAAGEPTLLTFDEVTTLFHEFGHGLHGIFSQVTYPTFAGTNVPRDFVEYPSQVNEMWAAFPDVVKNYAKHYKTGEAMPQALLDKLLATQKFGEAYATVQYLKATLLDLAWHTVPADQISSDVPAFEAAVFKKYHVDFEPIPTRYRSTYFSHIFSGEGYSAGYYAYIWADVLVADSIDWFKKNGGLKRESGAHFRATVLSHGDSVDSMVLFHEFTGNDPDVGPLLEKRGLK